MDDLKISHVDSKVVTGLIEYLESIYGKMHGSREKNTTTQGCGSVIPRTGRSRLA